MSPPLFAESTSGVPSAVCYSVHQLCIINVSLDKCNPSPTEWVVVFQGGFVPAISASRAHPTRTLPRRSSGSSMGFYHSPFSRSAGVQAYLAGVPAGRQEGRRRHCNGCLRACVLGESYASAPCRWFTNASPRRPADRHIRRSYPNCKPSCHPPRSPGLKE